MDWDDGGQLAWLEGAGVTLVRGHGRLAGERLVEATAAGGSTRLLAARQAVVVATGTASALPPVTNREGTASKAVPRRLAVLGGGVVAAELATTWRDLGSEFVLVLDRGPRLPSRVEPFASNAVAAGLRARGVDVRLEVSVLRVERPVPGGPVTVVLAGDRIEVDEVLVAVGRRPRTGDLGLEALGLEAGRSLEVDETCRVVAVPAG